MILGDHPAELDNLRQAEQTVDWITVLEAFLSNSLEQY